MLGFCGEHNITTDLEVTPIRKINEACKRMVKSDVQCRFSMDRASLKTESPKAFPGVRAVEKAGDFSRQRSHWAE